MISSGITRKIDDLGRIVLPKEIRKTLNINSGDDFQIIIDDNKIILERFSLLESFENKIIKIINCFIKETNYKILISINDRLINYDNINVSKVISNIIRERKIYYNDKYDKNIINSDLIIEGKIVILPIVIDSDLLGSIIVISDDNINNMIRITKIIYDLISINVK